MNYLNTDIQHILFQRVLNDDVYVDKSLLIEKISNRIGKGKNYICITKPRRFGKTINANMLGAYYTKGYGSRELFRGLAIEKTADFEKHLNQHNVISIDFSKMPIFCENYREYIMSIIEKLFSDLRKAYPEIETEDLDVAAFFRATGEQFVFILDEWDSVFYERFMRIEDKQAYLKFLKVLFKDQPYVELVYMTGVLPVAKYSSGSELNMFDEYTFMNDDIFDQYFGFLEEEVKELCDRQETLSYEEIKAWYDGYYTSDGRGLFNPRSVSMALLRGKCRSYWTETGPMNEIADCIEHNVDEVREDVVRLVAGIPVEVRLKGYSASEQQLHTRDEILSAMVVYGFLSYHDGMLKIPNHELMEKFQDVLSRESFGEVRKVVARSKEMLNATLACDGEKVAEILEYVHDREIPVLKYNDENSLSCVLTLCYLYARDFYKIEREMQTGKGYCDFIFFPNRKGMPGIVVELKMGHSCKEAVQQIKDRNYVQKLEGCREVLFVGINYNGKKHHECRIEKHIQKISS